MSFLRNLLASFVSIIIFTFIIVIIFVVALYESPSPIENNSVFKLELNGVISDRQNSTEFNFGKSSCTLDLENITNSIKYAADNEFISALHIHINDITGSLANAQDLKQCIEEFKKSGKPVITFSNGISQIGYYIATSSDSIFISNMAHFEWKGLGAQLLYFKSLLDKIGVQAEPIRAGKFKSAIEPFILNEISSENEFQIKVMIDNIWRNLKAEVEAKRKIHESKLDSIANHLGYLTPQEALKKGFVDGIKYTDQIEPINTKIITLNEIIEKINNDEILKDNDESPKIAVVFAEGAIIEKKSNTDISSKNYTQLLDKILKDENIKGVVLRINSPGGSARASEEIWRKVKLLQQKMPVYVSMGNIAASGGYYIATAADTIFAQNNTITGSIGVFGLMFNANELIKKIGINVEKVKTNELSDFPSFDRKLSDKEKDRIQTAISYVYDTFLNRVMEGRNLNKDAVEELASGRVWTGDQALKNNLIDQTGSLEDAINLMKRRLHDDNIQVVSLPKKLNTFEKIIKSFSEPKLQLPEPFSKYNYVIQNQDFLNSLQTPQARLPFILEIK